MNLMLMKKLFNIAVIFNETVFIEAVKLHLKSVVIIKEILYAAECS